MVLLEGASSPGDYLHLSGRYSVKIDSQKALGLMMVHIVIAWNSYRFIHLTSRTVFVIVLMVQKEFIPHDLTACSFPSVCWWTLDCWSIRRTSIFKSLIQCVFIVLMDITASKFLWLIRYCTDGCELLRSSCDERNPAPVDMEKGKSSFGFYGVYSIATGARFLTTTIWYWKFQSGIWF